MPHRTTTEASSRRLLIVGWSLAIVGSVGVRLWNALGGPTMWGYDGWGHVAYVLFLDIYGGVPWADQGWSYFHPPLYYALGWMLAQFGDGEVLMRGLACLGSLASLATAALAAFLVRRASPQRPSLTLLAFVGVACLPVHLYVSPMPGNKMAETFLSSAAIAVFISAAPRPSNWRLSDALTGVLLGLSLLTAFSGFLALVVVGISLALGSLPSSDLARTLRSVATRGFVIAGIALAVSAPYYARNIETFGTPFRKSSDFPAVREAESHQPPGSRGWRDFVNLSPRLFVEPDPLAPHLIHSLWGTAHVSIWGDVYRQTSEKLHPAARRRELRWLSIMMFLGVVPTLIGFLGGALAVRDVWRGRQRNLYLPIVLLACANVGAYAAYALFTTTWPAIKAYYLLGASLSYGVFLARGAEYLAQRRMVGLRVVAPLAVGVTAVCALALAIEGGVLPARRNSPATGAVHFYFEEYSDARSIYGPLAAGAPYPVPWLDNLAAIDLAEGQARRAAKFYQRAEWLAAEARHSDPFRMGRLAVATALAGDGPAAIKLLDGALGDSPLPELLANRGAIRAAEGDPAGAESDLQLALELEPALVPAWLNRAHVLTDLGRTDGARHAAARAAAQACESPRRYPYGLGSGEVLEWGIGRRWLLLLDGKGLRPALPSFYREACENLRDSR